MRSSQAFSKSFKLDSKLLNFSFKLAISSSFFNSYSSWALHLAARESLTYYVAPSSGVGFVSDAAALASSFFLELSAAAVFGKNTGILIPGISFLIVAGILGPFDSLINAS
jgi:hypothetical protein